MVGKGEEAAVVRTGAVVVAVAVRGGGVRRRREWPRWWGSASGVPATAKRKRVRGPKQAIRRKVNHLGPKAQCRC